MLLWMLLISVNSLFAQPVRPSLGTVYTGFGAYGSRDAAEFAFTANPASLCSVRHTSIAVFGERKYLLPELAQYQLVAVHPAGPGVFGLEALTSGSLAFRETRLGLSYARGLGKKMDAGISFGYHTISIREGYGSSATITTAAGLRMHLSDHLHAGVSFFNPAGGKFGKLKSEQLPSLYRFGLGFDASDWFYLEAVIEKEPDQPVNVILGWQYQPHPVIQVRAGVATATGSGWLGVGYRIKSMRVDVVATVHTQLGVSPGLLLTCRLKNKDQADQKKGK